MTQKSNLGTTVIISLKPYISYSFAYRYITGFMTERAADTDISIYLKIHAQVH